MYWNVQRWNNKYFITIIIIDGIFQQLNSNDYVHFSNLDTEGCLIHKLFLIEFKTHRFFYRRIILSVDKTNGYSL